MASKNQHRSHGNFDIRLDTGADDMMEPIACEKLLGGYISNDFKWNDQIKGKDGSIFKSVVSRINALKQISSFSSFKTRKMIANGAIMSKFLYPLQLWSGCPNYLLNLLQILQNRSARLVSNKDRYTPVKELLSSCGWLSIRQLVAFHRVLLLYKVNYDRKPKYFVENPKPLLQNSISRWWANKESQNLQVRWIQNKLCSRFYCCLEQTPSHD